MEKREIEYKMFLIKTNNNIEVINVPIIQREYKNKIINRDINKWFKRVEKILGGPCKLIDVVDSERGSIIFYVNENHQNNKFPINSICSKFDRMDIPKQYKDGSITDRNIYGNVLCVYIHSEIGLKYKDQEILKELEKL